MRVAGLLLLLLSTHAAAGSITHVYDGDTVNIQEGAWRFKLRIANIDAPELKQRYGKKSRRALMSLCQGRAISFQIVATDRYQRKIGALQCQQQDAGQWMLRNGHAWLDPRHAHNQTLQFAQNNAQQAKLGLWSYAKPTPPWIWRKKHAEKRK